MEENKTVNTEESAVTPEAETLTATELGEAEARIAQLEADRLKAIEEAANWKVAALKAKSKTRENFDDETDEERIRRITREELSNTKVAQIDAEKEDLLRKLARENKELKLAFSNKTKTPLATFGTHSEGPAVQDTSITPDQMAAFKAKGWSDKDIEHYKKNLHRYGK